MSVPDFKHVRDPNPDSENEVTLSNFPLHGKTESFVNNNNQNLPVAVRKGNREYIKQPLYPLANFISFKKDSSSHKTFLVSVNTIALPNTVSEALTNEKWEQVMNVVMEALEKSKTWELVKLPVEKKPVDC